MHSGMICFSIYNLSLLIQTKKNSFHAYALIINIGIYHDYKIIIKSVDLEIRYAPLFIMLTHNDNILTSLSYHSNLIGHWYPHLNTDFFTLNINTHYMPETTIIRLEIRYKPLLCSKKYKYFLFDQMLLSPTCKPINALFTLLTNYTIENLMISFETTT